ncbi:hypothetical protein GCM10022251_56710 [Phytohabitans flavus]|uniref:Uncharacterized protein n=2 Tax=Phytohabitans flavus TaxID=1076124 RepID=A0A6F8XQR7_9ACTN|nr:hypothetical protein [Phytohabitans flavus]BCB76098.1 hypothetical protein Pflav_025080 [Phytohabitans flavus]
MRERTLLLEEGERLRAEARIRPALEAAPLWRAFEKVTERYRELLPEVPVARCPFTDAPVWWPIDTAGLDGWFWEYPSGARRHPRTRPPTWVAMTGAMRLAEPVEYTPFPVVPGPGAPFVVPRILGSAPEVRAVIAEVAVGRHTGWAISYFGRPAAGTRLVNLWGGDSYPVVEDGLWTGWERERSGVERYDFDLEPWIGTGALLWITPGDESATLRQGVDKCPYLDLPGPRGLGVVGYGQVRYTPRLG